MASRLTYLKRILLIITTTIASILTLTTALATLSGIAHAAPLKAAFVYVGPANHVGWSYAHDLGRQAIDEHFGGKVETSYVEFVPEGRSSRETLQKLADENDIIFTTSMGYMVSSAHIARQNPDVKFEHATGDRSSVNLANYATRAYEPRYLAGYIAGKMSRSNKIGYVAAHAIPEVIRGINAFTLGVKAANPDAEVLLEWTKSWYAPEKAASLANKLIDQGADVMTHHTDSPAVAEVAEKRQTYVISYHADMSSFAPEYHLASVIHDWAPYYVKRIEALLNNNWQSGSEWTGMKESTSRLVHLSRKIPADVLQDVEQLQRQITEGKKQVFAGPITNHRGRTRVRQGQALDDEALHRMNWYVQGVKGSLLFF